MTAKTSNSSTQEGSGLVGLGRKIEEESFRIIDEEIGSHDFPPDQWEIVRRVIHTTGDFDFARCIRFHPSAIASATAALRRGATIFTDTRMIRAGLSSWRLTWFGNEVITPAVQPETRDVAELMGITRSVAAFRGLSQELNGSLVAIGNAPTALLEVIRLITEENVRPSLVIGVPVGFVQAAESKEKLWELTEQPTITILGRKGGSSIAVAILHALFELAKKGNC